MTTKPFIKVCKNGVTRLVILIGPYAFKFPRFDLSWKMGLHGLLSNMQEAAFSKIKNPKTKYCPTLFSIPGGFMNVQQRAKPLSDKQWNNLSCLTFKGYIHEMKRDGFGVIGRKVVILDYGSET